MPTSIHKIPNNEQKSSITLIEEMFNFEEGHFFVPEDKLWIHTLKNVYEFQHIHNVIELGICVSGKGIFHTKDQSIPFVGESFSFIMPDVWHSAHSTGIDQSVWNFIYISTDIIGGFNDSKSLINSLKGTCICKGKNSEPETFELVKSFFSLCYQDIPNKQLVLSSLLRTIMILQKSIIHKKNIKANKKDLTPIIPAIDYINANYMKNITLQKAASLCFCSKSTLRRNFLELTGKTPYEYIEEIRMNIAKTLLAEEKKITDVALEAGYPTISCFNKKFKKLYKVSPKEFQKQFK